MRIGLKWHDANNVRIFCYDKNDYLWDEIRRKFPSNKPYDSASFLISFSDLIAGWGDVFPYLKRLKLSGVDIGFDVDKTLKQDVEDYGHRQKIIRREISQDELQVLLNNSGFRRLLKDFQKKNVCQLIRANQGATFSVPGAGKTTEALAYFYATASGNDKLLVVAPLNAFGAWDEQLQACTGNNRLSFVRLTGRFEKTLLEGHRFLLINYELFQRDSALQRIRDFLRDDRNVYVFLDESHKIKNENSGRAQAVREIQCFPKAKLIMSGTPMPQAPRDLLSQYRFLFPDQSVSEENVIQKFQGIYVRTTASQLGIEPIRYLKKEIPLDEVEKQLYRKMRKLSLSKLGKPSQEATYIRNLGKSVMRLMSFVSNPALVAPYFGTVIPGLSDYLARNDGKKIEYVCNRARELASQGKKVLVWSCFVKNVEIISSRLQDLGADYIHGGVKAGDSANSETREGKIKRFLQNNGRHMVLVANPAAASEGISLHSACQYAIYLDRSFNAAQFLQSQDRIHRLGLPANTFPEIELVVCPETIDELVNLRLNVKIQTMAEALNDQSIVPTDPELLYDDDDDDPDDETNAGISKDDIEAILKHLGAE